MFVPSHAVTPLNNVSVVCFGGVGEPVTPLIPDPLCLLRAALAGGKEVAPLAEAHCHQR